MIYVMAFCVVSCYKTTCPMLLLCFSIVWMHARCDNIQTMAKLETLIDLYGENQDTVNER